MQRLCNIDSDQDRPSSPVTFDDVGRGRVRDEHGRGGSWTVGAGNLDAEHRLNRVWRGWLRAMARDPEAALAAAQAYQRLDGRGRDDWLSALETDVSSLGVPSVAVYAPLLAVEAEPSRRRRISAAISFGSSSLCCTAARRALLGLLPQGGHLAVLIEPLYLNFVQVLACAYTPGRRLAWVRHDPIAADDQVVVAGSQLEGAVLEPVPLRAIVDELARTIVAHGRHHGELPEALGLFAHLFGLEHLTRADWESDS